MFRGFVFLISVTLLPIIALAEQVTTTDGRIITLNDDGTYILDAQEREETESYVEVLDPLFEAHVSEFGREAIRFMPKFTNVSENPIVGLKFRAEFSNAFGDEIWTMTGDISERVAQQSASNADVFYIIENNPFVGGEVYDKLLPMVSGDTGSITVSIVAIAFDGGEVVTFE